MSNASDPFGPVDLPLEGVSTPEREPGRLERADAAVPELDGRLDGVVHLPAGYERAQKAADHVDLTDEVASEVDHMSGEIAERSRACGPAVEAPDLLGGVPPVLQVAAAKVPDLPELARLDQLPCEADSRDEAVVERAHVLHAGRGDTTPDVVALVRVAPKRLLAHDVLAGLGGENRRLGVQVVRAEIVEETDPWVGDQLSPVARPALEAVASRGLRDRLPRSGRRSKPVAA